jgi:type 1 glutamine amidotransferase
MARRQLLFDHRGRAAVCRLKAFLTAIVVAQALVVGAAEPAHKTVLLLGQHPDGHPPTTHEYMPGVERLGKLLEPTPGLKVQIASADEPWTGGPALLEQVDGVVLFLSEGARWCQADPRRYEALSRLAARGGGLVALHWAIGTKAAEPIGPFVKLFGGCHGGPDRKYQVVETDLDVSDPTHPITAGLKGFHVRDEFYYQLKLAQPEGSVRPVLLATIDGRKETVAWSWERPDGGRSFGFSGLHFDDNWKVPEYRTLATQAVLWTLKLPK